ncbi:hypothetical protein [Rhodococcus sp. 24CO]|uniref:hypothetical protein n=1 Tax=Rhodococcus sp. 24CO TaxID=3117460 RepID=UPI003D3319E0
MVHSSDVADAYVAAPLGEQQCAFSLAADPPVGMDTLADWFDARLIDIPEPVIRASLWAAWRAHTVPATPGPIDTVIGRWQSGWFADHVCCTYPAYRAFLDAIRPSLPTTDDLVHALRDVPRG